MTSRKLRIVLVVALSVFAARGAETKKLNVLFLMSDDLRPELGCYGHPSVKTPNIDALARAGVRFGRAYVQFPLCNPSRTSLLTGRHPTTTGVLDNRTWVGAAHPDFVTLPKHFKANGYVTLRAGKIFHGGIDDFDAWTEGGEKRDFEGATQVRPTPPNRQQLSDRRVVLEGEGEEHGDYRAAARTIEYLRSHRDRPFFLACGFSKPHSPPTAPRKYYDMYDAVKVPLPVDFASTPAAPPGFPKPSVTRNGDLFIGREASEAEAREMIRAYWASVTWMDSNVGRVISELDRLGLRESTVIVFWGDHGYHLGEKGKWAKHGSLFEIGTRVPLIIAAPGAKGNGASSNRIVQALDLYPTLVGLCGLPMPHGLEGRSLEPLLANPRATWNHPAYTVVGNNDRLAGVAVRTDRFRYAEYVGGGGAMLFDHRSDPHELKNLADDRKHAAVKAETSHLVARFRAPQSTR